MTVSTTQSRVVYAGNGITTVFPFAFIIPEAGDEQITYTDAFGNSTVLASTLYSVSGFNSATGGSVQYPLSGTPIPAGTSITIARNVTYVQGTSLQNQGAFLPHSTEGALDYLEMEIQQLEDGLSRALVVPASDPNPLNTLPTVALRANTLLGFNATGQPVSVPAQGVTIVTSNQAVYYTRALAIAAQIPTSVQAIVVCGRALPGDCPSAAYVKLASAPSPSYAWQFQSADGAWWQFFEAVVRPEQLSAVGATDDSAALATASACALALGIELVIDQLHTITNAITFTVSPRFTGNGRLKPSTISQITYAAGFDAPLHQFIMDMSSITSTQTTSGMATASVTARELTPQMFGAVENSPSSSAANVRRVQDWLNAVSVSGLEGVVPPVDFNLNNSVVFDYNAGEYKGVTFRGKGGGRSRFVFDAGTGVASCFKVTSSGLSVNGQKAEFYGTIEGIGFIGSPPNLASPSRVLQFGETLINQSGIGVGGPTVFFNGLNILDVTVNNNQAGGWGTLFTGFASCHTELTSDCAGPAYDGSAGCAFIFCSYSKWMLRPGSANYGLYVPAYSPDDPSHYPNFSYANDFNVGDYEVVKTAVYNRSPSFTDNKITGIFSGNDQAIDSTAGRGNTVTKGSLWLSVVVSTFANPNAALGTWGGTGFTVEMPNDNFWGQILPFSTPSPPTLTTDVWIPNIYGQDYMISVLSNQPTTTYKRGYADRSSAGSQVYVGGISGSFQTVAYFLLKAGESFMCHCPGGTLSYFVDPKE